MNLLDLFDRGAALRPDGVCFVLPDGTGARTYREVQDLSHRVAASLRRDGLGDGARIGVLSPNDPLAFCVLLGVLRAGGVWVALNAASSPGDVAELMETVRCDAMFHAPVKAEHASLAQDEVPTLRTLLSFDDLEGWLEPEGARVPELPDAPDGVVMMLGTGGTTGKPKAVTITNRQFVTMTLAFLAHLPEEDPVQLLAAPMTHAAGGIAFCVFAVAGVTVVHQGVDPKLMFGSIERHRVTRLFLPPTAIYALLAHPDVRAHDFSSLRHFMYAAAPMSVDKLREAMDVFGPVMAQTFGQSEAPMICTVMTPRDHVEALADESTAGRLASCGRPSVVASVAVMDDDGNLLATGETGEIVVRGDLVMSQGYYLDPENTAEVRRPGGWHGTGDVGRFDEDGFLYIVDRKRDLIISGGFNVFPSEVERVIWSHPAVEDCAVIGIPDEKWGEAVTAVVELKDGAELDDRAVMAMCRERLGPVKTPKSVIFRELPRSPVGKVLKRELRDEFWSGRARAV